MSSFTAVSGYHDTKNCASTQLFQNFWSLQNGKGRVAYGWNVWELRAPHHAGSCSEKLM